MAEIGGVALYDQPFKHRLAPIVDADRARLLAVGERQEQVGQLRVAVLLDEPRHRVAPAPAVRLTDDRQGRATKVGQDYRRRVAWVTSSRTPGS